MLRCLFKKVFALCIEVSVEKGGMTIPKLCPLIGMFLSEVFNSLRFPLVEVSIDRVCSVL